MKKTTGKIMAIAAAMALCGALTACGGASESTGSTSADGSSFKASSAITVISREDGSGTRGAFVELFGVEQKNDQGEKI